MARGGRDVARRRRTPGVDNESVVESVSDEERADPRFHIYIDAYGRKRKRLRLNVDPGEVRRGKA